MPNELKEQEVVESSSDELLKRRKKRNGSDKYKRSEDPEEALRKIADKEAKRQAAKEMQAREDGVTQKLLDRQFDEDAALIAAAKDAGVSLVQYMVLQQEARLAKLSDPIAKQWMQKDIENRAEKIVARHDVQLQQRRAIEQAEQALREQQEALAAHHQRMLSYEQDLLENEKQIIRARVEHQKNQDGYEPQERGELRFMRMQYKRDKEIEARSAQKAENLKVIADLTKALSRIEYKIAQQQAQMQSAKEASQAEDAGKIERKDAAHAEKKYRMLLKEKQRMVVRVGALECENEALSPRDDEVKRPPLLANANDKPEGMRLKKTPKPTPSEAWQSEADELRERIAEKEASMKRIREEGGLVTSLAITNLEQMQAKLTKLKRQVALAEKRADRIDPKKAKRDARAQQGSASGVEMNSDEPSQTAWEQRVREERAYSLGRESGIH